MKKYLLSAMIVTGLLLSISSCKNKGGVDNYQLKTTIDSVSYIIGTDIGKDFKGRGIETVPEALAKGIKDALKDEKNLLIKDEAKMRIIMAFQQEMQKKMEGEKSKKAAENKKKSEAYLNENKNKQGVKVTPSGLQYKMIVEGKGKAPKTYDTIVVHYKGKLVDGTEFDNSYSRNQPAKQPLDAFIPGWKEGILLLKEGGKIELAIPPELAYGDQGAGDVIPGGSVLLFEVELLKVIPGNPNAKPKENPMMKK
jgi:FKBP-type peptidyl-prolyl cis-trans isomerase